MAGKQPDEAPAATVTLPQGSHLPCSGGSTVFSLRGTTWELSPGQYRLVVRVHHDLLSGARRRLRQQGEPASFPLQHIEVCACPLCALRACHRHDFLVPSA